MSLADANHIASELSAKAKEFADQPDQNRRLPEVALAAQIVRNDASLAEAVVGLASCLRLRRVVRCRDRR